MAALLLTLLSGCAGDISSFMDPAGPIASAQRTHLIRVVAITMVAILPVLLLVPLLIWRYRYRNTARYAPDWGFSRPLEFLMWGVPVAIVAVLAVQLWASTRALDPYKPIDLAQAQLKVQVIGLDWKWLFIYPDLGIASVGEMAFPAEQPVALELTTDTVMQSFMIGALAGQVYTMPGMETQLHILAHQPGTFQGQNMQYNGDGFAQQKFDAVAMIPADFADWVARVRADGVPLDTGSYATLAQRTTKAAAHAALGTDAMPGDTLYFHPVNAGLFETVIGRYHQGQKLGPAEQPGAPGYAPPASADGGPE
ncbi:cytochrome ubiquinol oxidase subunit II [Roseovarius sp. S1116L3]|uniref:cytochrome ubiquinol oxidase subunit II n=1 Tax=Roseovarius roseus TaxID=3342636 RepID=UPI0037276A66